MTSNILAKDSGSENISVVKKTMSQKKSRSIITLGIATAVVLIVTNSVMAQEALVNNVTVCPSTGIFSRVTNLLVTVLETITGGGIEVGALNRLICQVTGFMVVGLLVGFIQTLFLTWIQLRSND